MVVNKVCLEVATSMHVVVRVICFEHEIPIYQAAFGKLNVSVVDDTLNRDGPVNIDMDFDVEWERLMHKPRMIDTGNDKVPAPVVAFPRGPLDIENFYERLEHSKRTASITPAPAPKQEEEPVRRAGIPSAKEQRAAAKARLDKLGIEYKGNASTDDLIALLNEVDVPPVDEDDDATVQNEERAAV